MSVTQPGTSESAAFNQEVTISWILYLTAKGGGVIDCMCLWPDRSARFPGRVCVLLLLAVCSANEARMLSESLMSR